jgi:hypothetical protein
MLLRKGQGEPYTRRERRTMSRVASSRYPGTPTKIDEGIPITSFDLFHRVLFVPLG